MCEITIKVVPNAKKTECVGLEEDVIKIRIASPPIDGKANEALIAYLAKVLKVGKREITFISGKTSRLKKLHIDTLSRQEVLFRLGLERLVT